MVTSYPGHVIRKIMYWGYTVHGMDFTGLLEHETKIHIVSIAVTTMSECLPGIAVAEVVDPVIPDCPGMTGRNTPRMTPDQRRRGIRQPFRKRLMIVDDVCPNESSLMV